MRQDYAHTTHVAAQAGNTSPGACGTGLSPPTWWPWHRPKRKSPTVITWSLGVYGVGTAHTRTTVSARATRTRTRRAVAPLCRGTFPRRTLRESYERPSKSPSGSHKPPDQSVMRGCQSTGQCCACSRTRSRLYAKVPSAENVLYLPRHQKRLRLGHSASVRCTARAAFGGERSACLELRWKVRFSMRDVQIPNRKDEHISRSADYAR